MSAVPKPEFFEVLARAARGGAEISLVSLLSLVDLSAGQTLGQLAQLSVLHDFLDQSQLQLHPDIQEFGDLESRRVLRFKTTTGTSGFDAPAELQEGEAYDREFKSSLMFDHKKSAATPGLAPKEYRNDDLVFSVLKTLAAFLNSGSGTLLVGVRDDGSICGVDDDFPFLKKPDLDSWELFLRDKISTSFHSGQQVNDYIDISFCAAAEGAVARVRTARRRDLCYLKDKKGDVCIYRRQGNRTVKSEVFEIEELVRTRDSQAIQFSGRR